jgi:hypothetical protein
MSESYLKDKIQRELRRIRVAKPDAYTVRKKFAEADGAYRHAVAEGDGSSCSGDVITHYYITRQAYMLYAIDEGISLKVG